MTQYRNVCIEAVRTNFMASATALTSITGIDGSTDEFLYTSDGDRIYSAAGFMVTANGDPVHIDDLEASDRSGSLVLYWDDEEGGAYDSADRLMRIYFNSFFNRNELMSGMLRSGSINLSNNLAVVTYHRPGQKAMEIFVTHETVREGGIHIGNLHLFYTPVTRFADMNGRRINSDHIVGFHQRRPMWHPMTALLTGLTFGAWLLYDQGSYFLFFRLLEYVTLSDLRREIRLARFHAWPRILNIATGDFIVTADGLDEVRVNPRTYQVVDFYGLPIVHADTRLPMVLYDGRVVSAFKQLMHLQGDVLMHTLTVNNMLMAGTDFYMASMSVGYFPNLVFPVLNVGTYEEPVWVFPDGRDASPYMESMGHMRAPDNPPIVLDPFDPGGWFFWFLMLGAVMAVVVVVILITMFIRRITGFGASKTVIQMSPNGSGYHNRSKKKNRNKRHRKR